MRSYLPGLELRQPRDLDDLLRLLAAEPGAWRPFAGGTDLMVLLEAGRLPHARYVNLWGLPGLRGIDVTAESIAIGSMTTYTDIIRHPVLQSECAMLCRAARETGGIATQNRGTIGGNIANASPAADTPPALLVYDAELELVSARGTRQVAYDRFHSGYKVMDLAPDEIIRSVRIPRRPRPWRESYRKVGTRRAQAISKLCFAAGIDVDAGVVRDVRIAYGSVAPTVVRCRDVEGVLRGKPLAPGLADAAAASLDRDIAPIDDLRSTSRYRRTVSRNLLHDFMRSAAQGQI
jgi:CO/xanthine dehydrogenase FAD-binding subunit